MSRHTSRANFELRGFELVFFRDDLDSQGIDKLRSKNRGVALKSVSFLAYPLVRIFHSLRKITRFSMGKSSNYMDHGP